MCLPGLLGRVGYVDQGCAGACEALPGRLRARPHIGSRLAVQTFSLDKRGTGGRIPERAFQVSSSLGVVMRTLATGSFTSGNVKPAEPDVVHDHIRLREHQIGAVASIGVRLARDVKHAGTIEGGEVMAARRAAMSSARVGTLPR